MAAKKPAPTYDPAILDALLDRGWHNSWDNLFKTLSAAPWAATAPQWLAHADARLSAMFEDEARKWPSYSFGRKGLPAALPLARSLFTPHQPARFDALIDSFSRLTPQTAPPLTELTARSYGSITRALTDAEADTIWDRLSLAPLRKVVLSDAPSVVALTDALPRAQVLSVVESLAARNISDDALAAILNAPHATSLAALDATLNAPLSVATARAFAPHAARLKTLHLSGGLDLDAPLPHDALAALAAHPWDTLESLTLAPALFKQRGGTPATLRAMLEAAPALIQLKAQLDDALRDGVATLAAAPRGALRELELRGKRPDATDAALLTSPACAQLEHLKLHGEPGALTAAALRAIPSLQSLTISAPRGHDNAPLWDGLRGARLPALRELNTRELPASNLLDALETMDLPALRKLRLDMYGHDAAAIPRLAALPWLYQCQLILENMPASTHDRVYKLHALARETRSGAPEKT